VEKQPWSVEIFAHKHGLPSRLMVSTMTIYLLAKVFITEFSDSSIIVKPVDKESGSLQIHPIMDDIHIAKYLQVLGSIYEVV
jgi:hypothetical protein